MSFRITSEIHRVVSGAQAQPPSARREAATGSASAAAGAPHVGSGPERLALRNALEGLDRARLAEGLLAAGGEGAAQDVARLAADDPRLAPAAQLALAGDVSGAHEAARVALAGAADRAEGAALAVANVSAAVERLEDATRVGKVVEDLRATLVASGESALAAQANQSSDRVAGLLG